MSATERRRRLREILAADECVCPALLFDPISAHFAEDLGYELGMVIPSMAAAAVLGAPSELVLNSTEFAQITRRICRATSIGVLVSAHQGFGNALNIMRTVEELESAG